jgi:hypothetical protein
LQSSDFVQNDPEVCPQVRVAMDNKTNATTRAGERLEDFMRIGGGAMQWSKNDNFMSHTGRSKKPVKIPDLRKKNCLVENKLQEQINSQMN